MRPSDVPVSGDYPNVTLSTSLEALVARFQGRLDKAKDIAGDYGAVAGNYGPFALRFKRADNDGCAAAPVIRARTHCT